MNNLTKLLLSLLPISMLTACNDSPSGPNIDPAVYNIVTYESTTLDGSVAVFTYQVLDDSPVITLTADWKVPDGIDPGTRLLLAYVTETPEKSGPIEVKQAVVIPGGKPVEAAKIPYSEPLQIRSLWRTGNYLNLDGVVTLSGTAKEISLYAVEKSLDKATVQLAIIIGEGDGPVGAEVKKTLYASWNISEIWNKTTCEAIDVFFTDALGRTQSITIQK